MGGTSVLLLFLGLDVWEERERACYKYFSLSFQKKKKVFIKWENNHGIIHRHVSYPLIPEQ